ncbi:Protein C10 [Lamellibrachia satsuma]|nr:Protein C10 [Lamellibrachia satsuma]
MASAVGERSFSTEDAKLALLDILNAFKVPENLVLLEEARERAGNDMLKTMQIVFPITTQIQMQIISKYGFPADGDGIVRFAQTIKLYEKQDAELAKLNTELFSVIMPQMAAPAPPQPQQQQPLPAS